MSVVDSSDCTSLTGWTTDPEGGYPQISGGFILVKNTGASGWNEVGLYRTTPQTLASGYTFFWTKRTDNLDSGQAEFHLLKDATGIAYDSGGTIRGGLIWNWSAANSIHYVAVWDTDTSAETLLEYSTATDYECKGVVNANGTVTFSYKVAGDWVEIGSTTLAHTPSVIGPDIYFSENAYGLGGDYYLKNYELNTVDTSTDAAPTVDAGGDLACRLSDGVSINATVVDDGSNTKTWSKVSGPGTVTFGSGSSEDTTATFSVVGRYVLRLSVDDGVNSVVTDDVVVLVVDDSETIIKHDNFVADSGYWTDITTAGTVARSGGLRVFTPSGAAWDVCGSYMSLGTSAIGMRIYFDMYDPVTNGDSICTMRTATGITKSVGAGWNFESGGSGKCRPWESNANQGTGLPAITDRGNGISHCYGEVQADGKVKLYYSGPNLSTLTLLHTSSSTSFGSGTLYWGFNNHNSVQKIGNITVTVPNSAPVVNAGNDADIIITDGVDLDGTVTDDGLPLSPGTVSTLWTKVSGPGDVTFDDDTAVDTHADFSDAGSYVLKLTADDGEAVSSDTVVILVSFPTPNVLAVSNPGKKLIAMGQM